jgi:hypothetical protein
MDERSPVRTQLLVGLGVLLAVALLIGGIVGVVAIKAADVAGLGETDPTGTGNDGPPLGVGTNSRPPDPTSAPTTAAPTTPTPTQAPSTPTETTKTRKPPGNPIRLTASPDQAGTYERVNLTGTYPRGEGSTLQVQRQEGGAWVDFPTGATVRDGTFSTYIETGHTGPNRFRVIDENGRTSNVVVVQIS